jgi:hypothetical protein
MASYKNTIKVRLFQNIQDEYVANAWITPGMLVEVMSTGKIRKHATASGNVVPVMVAIEDELQGKEITDNYVANDRVQVITPHAGDILLLLLADGQNVAIGDALESDGLGHVQKHTVESWNSNDAQVANSVYSRPIVGYAQEAQNLSTLEGSESSAVENSQYIMVLIA